MCPSRLKVPRHFALDSKAGMVKRITASSLMTRRVDTLPWPQYQSGFPRTIQLRGLLSKRSSWGRALGVCVSSFRSEALLWL
jgi:hypothetical protein